MEQLALIGQGPARFFRDACRVMNGEVVLDAATHTVAHYLREIDSAIRKVLEPMVSQMRQAEIKAMKKGSHQAWIEEMVVLLGFVDSETAAARWHGVAGQLHDLAHRDALAQPRPIDAPFRRLWDEAQEVYELLSRQFASSFLATMPLIDALAVKPAPGEMDASALRNTVPQSVVALDRFFGQLDSPAWLETLRSNTDYFTAPLPLRRGEDGSAAYTPWPPGQYLVRMAALESERATVINIAIALETDNPEAHERVTEAALAMPAEDAARLVEKIGEFLQSPFQWVLPMKATDLAQQLVAGGEVDAGLALLRAILAGPRVTNDQWVYLHTLEESAAGFFPASGVSGVALVADLLDDVIGSRSQTASESGDDHSYIWRQALEHGRPHDAKDVLVTALRGALGAVAESDASIVPELVALLEARTHAIFRRLALDCVHRAPTGLERP